MQAAWQDDEGLIDFPAGWSTAKSSWMDSKVCRSKRQTVWRATAEEQKVRFGPLGFEQLGAPSLLSASDALSMKLAKGFPRIRMGHFHFNF